MGVEYRKNDALYFTAMMRECNLGHGVERRSLCVGVGGVCVQQWEMRCKHKTELSRTIIS